MMDPKQGDRPPADFDPLEKTPEAFFRDLGTGMLLGSVSSETVRILFENLFPRGEEDLESLPLEWKAMVRNILRVYPDVARNLALDGTPCVRAVFESLARFFGADRTRGEGDDVRSLSGLPVQGARGLDWAAGEPQEAFQVSPGTLPPAVGVSRLQSAEGNWFRLRVRCDLARKQLHISTTGLDTRVEILLDDCPLISLDPSRRRGTVSLARFLEIARNLAPEHMAPVVRCSPVAGSRIRHPSAPRSKSPGA